MKIKNLSWLSKNKLVYIKGKEIQYASTKYSMPNTFCLAFI